MTPLLIYITDKNPNAMTDTISTAPTPTGSMDQSSHHCLTEQRKEETEESTVLC